MAVTRAQRRAARQARFDEAFGPEHAHAALDLLEVLEYAWHDCYGKPTPPDEVVENIVIVAQGDFESLIYAVRLALIDARDLQVAADEIRAGSPGRGPAWLRTLDGVGKLRGIRGG